MEWILNRHFWIVHLVLIGLFALALAIVVTQMVGNRLDVDLRQVEHPIQRSPRTLRNQGKRPSYYSVILDRNIFRAVIKETSPKGQSSAQKPVAAAQVETLARTPLDIKLRGTAVRDGGDSFAVIEDRPTRKEDLYRAGDMIQGEAKLLQIFHDRVVILREGKQEILELSVGTEQTKERRSSAASPKRPPTVLGGGVRRLGPTRWSISQEEMESAKANMSQLMTQVRIVPNFTEGKPDGFKLLSIKRGSLFDRLGLRNGDVVRQINGVPLDNPQKALEVYGDLVSGQSIALDILRGGREQTFTYEVK
jgi:general secretion pathway protein C